MLRTITQAPQPDFLNTKEVAAILRVSPYSLKRYIRDGKLKASYVGHTYLITPDEVSRFVDSLSGKIAPTPRA